MKTTILLGFLLIFTTVNVWSQCSDSAKKELEAFDREWGRASLAGERDKMMTIYADDYSGLPDSQSKALAISGAMAAFAEETAKPNGVKVTHEHYFIACTPATATISHRNTIWTPGVNGGKPTSSFTRSLHILEKRGGRWQVVSNAGGSIDDYSTLWYLEQDWNDATLNRDRGWFESTYSPNFGSVSSSSARIFGRSADIEDTMNDKSKYDLIETTEMQVRIDGTTAIVNGVFRMKGTNEKGVAVDRRSRFTDTWIKRDGRWQVLATAGTLIP
jgi:ketosteroid isomerase-like protein